MKILLNDIIILYKESVNLIKQLAAAALFNLSANSNDFK